MKVARVIGNVWATRKHPDLENIKMLLVQEVNGQNGQVEGETLLAMDSRFGAGPGDTVLLLDEGGSARQILRKKTAPVRLAVCGIVDSVSLHRRTVKYH